MKNSQKAILVSIGAAMALSAVNVSAAENPFAIKTLSSGYQVADNHDIKMGGGGEGKCGTGKCGANKKAKEAKDGSCQHNKAKEGGCGAEKMKEGACSAEKMKEGKCGSKS